MDIGQPSRVAPPPARAPFRRVLWGLRRLAVAGLLLAALAGAAWFTHRFLTQVVVDDARVAADMVTVASRVPGWVTEVRVIAGDQAGRGEVLVRIDGREQELLLRELEARIAGLDARRRELEARIAMVDLRTGSEQAASRAQLEVARAGVPAAEAEEVYAEAEFNRANQLMATASGTRQRYDQARSLLDAARQKVLGAVAEIRHAEAQIATADAGREELNVLARQLDGLGPQARELAAQRDRVALDIADRTIRMPFDGSVDRVFADAGEYVAAGQRLLTLHDPAGVRIEANVKETELRHFRRHAGAGIGGCLSRPRIRRRGGAGRRRRNERVRPSAHPKPERQFHQDHPAPAGSDRNRPTSRGLRPGMMVEVRTSVGE